MKNFWRGYSGIEKGFEVVEDSGLRALFRRDGRWMRISHSLGGKEIRREKYPYLDMSDSDSQILMLISAYRSGYPSFDLLSDCMVRDCLIAYRKEVWGRWWRLRMIIERSRIWLAKNIVGGVT